MKNFFTQDFLALWKEYTDTYHYEERSVLKALIPICLEHEGTLPQTFDFSIIRPDKRAIAKVLKDLGCEIPKISYYGETVFINLS